MQEIYENYGDCVDDEWSCPDGVCIPMIALCDGFYDCFNGFDEFGCPGKNVTAGKCILLFNYFKKVFLKFKLENFPTTATCNYLLMLL